MATCRTILRLALVLSMIMSGILVSLANASFVFDRMVNVTGELANPMLSIEQFQVLTKSTDKASRWLLNLPEISLRNRGRQLASNKQQTLLLIKGLQHTLEDFLCARSELLHSTYNELKNASTVLEAYKRWELTNQNTFVLRWFQKVSKRNKVSLAFKQVHKQSYASAKKLLYQTRETTKLFEHFADNIDYVYFLLKRLDADYFPGDDWFERWTHRERWSISRALEKWMSEDFMAANHDVLLELSIASKALESIIDTEQRSWKPLSGPTGFREQLMAIQTLMGTLRDQYMQLDKEIWKLREHFFRVYDLESVSKGG